MRWAIAFGIIAVIFIIMSEIRFYHLLRQNVEQALPGLLSKALETGKRIIVRAPDRQAAERLNDALWTYDAASFCRMALKKTVIVNLNQFLSPIRRM